MGRILLLVELKGGNDGLNTLVPYADPQVPRAAARLGVARERVAAARRAGGPARQARAVDGIVEGRDLAILQGVGYPYPNRSHFRSIEIWDTASAVEPDSERGLDRPGLRGHQRCPRAPASTAS